LAVFSGFVRPAEQQFNDFPQSRASVLFFTDEENFEK